MFQRKFFRNQSSSLGASILAIAYAGSYLLGLVRDRTLAHYFPTAIKETYDAAFQVPDLIFNLFAAGLLSAAVFLPIFRELVDQKEEEKAYSLASTLLNIISILIILLGLVCFWLMPSLSKLIVPGFDPERQALVSNLSRIMLLSPLLFGISNVLGNILYSFKRFFAYGFAILLYNGSIILSIVFLQEKLGIYSAAIGLVIGVFLHLLFRLGELSFTNFRYSPTIKLGSTELRQLIKLAIPKTLGQLSEQAKLLIFNRVGSILSTGSLSAFNYARNIQSFPVSLIGISLASAVFPELASYAGQRQSAQLEKVLLKSLGRILFFSLPAACAIAYLSPLLVGLLLKTGQFSTTDLELTSLALSFFAISIPTESLLHLFARLFYAYQKVWTPVLTSIFCALLNIFLSYFLAAYLGWGAAGLALSFSIYTSLQMLLLMILSHLLLFRFSLRKLFLRIFKLVLASALMLLTLWGTELILQNYAVFTKLLLLSLAGGLSYLLAALLLRCEELQLLRSKLRL